MTWSSGSGLLYGSSNTAASIAVYDTNPAAQTDTASDTAWSNTNSRSWGSIALELQGLG